MKHTNIFFASAALLALVACSNSGNQPVVEAAKPAPVAAPVAAHGDDDVLGSGPIVVENQVDMTAQRDGMVATINVETGTAVRRGDLLATLDAQQVAAQAEAAEAKAKSIEADVKNWEAETKIAQADAERAQGMWDSQLITKQDLEHAQYRVEASRYEVQRERENLRNAQAEARALALEAAKTRIVAPFDGVVARRYVRVGQRVAKDDKLFWVSATGPLRIRFMVPELSAGKIKKSTVLRLSSSGAPDERHTATIIAVSPVVDPASGTLEAIAEVNGAPGQLRPGMIADLHLEKQ
jgi:RND family efflux transporter MFP subunit